LAGASKAAGSARGFIEIINLENRGLFDSLNDELRDAIAAPDLKLFHPVGIDDYHGDFAPISRVDQAGRVDQGNAMPRRKAAPGKHKSREPRWYRQGNSGWDSRTFARPKEQIHSAGQIETSVVCMLITRSGQPVIQ
jgi:hypothetical protein